MINKNKNIKTKILASVVAFFMLLANGGIVLATLTKSAIEKITYAEYAPTVMTITNGNFSNPSSGSYPLTPANWTSVNKTDDITSGLISIDTSVANDETVSNDYKLNSLPSSYTGMNDKQVLMINSKNSESYCGYKSNDVSLSAGGYYVFSFWAYTEPSTIASAFLAGNDTTEKQSLSIYTNAQWKDYKIFIKTDSINALSLALQLNLGSETQPSKGSVFFDQVSALKYSQDLFEKTYNNDKQNNAERIIYIDVASDQKDLTATSFITNPSFENGLNGWTVCDGCSVDTISNVYNINEAYDASQTKITTSPTNANLLNNENALLINNMNAGHFGYKSSYFTVKQNQLYKLSFIAKTNAISGNAHVDLVERNPYTNETLSDGTTNPLYYKDSSYEAKTFTIENISTSDYTNNETNNWKSYSFYIQGNPYFDSELNLELWLGTSDEDATGYIFFDNFTLTQLNTTDYTSGSANGTKANLNQATTSTDISNGTFNDMKITSVDDGYPYVPTDWNISTEKSNETVQNGIINTSNCKQEIGIAIPSISNQFTNNNVLMIGNKSDNKQVYTSTSTTLSADSYYKISVDSLTKDITKTGAGIRLKANGNVIGEVLNIKTNTWKNYSFIIKTGFASTQVTVELSLGESGLTSGYAFFDNVLLASGLSEEDYNKTLSANEKHINLSEYTFSNVPETPTNDLYSPYDFTAENKGKINDGSVVSGVINTSEYDEGFGKNTTLENPSQPKDQDDYVLMISSNNDVYYTYTSNVSTNFTSGEYYKVEVDVKTAKNSLSQDESNTQYKDENKKEAYPFGASISLSGIDASFTGINTEGEYKTYTMYIKCTTDSEIKLVLSLGSEKALTSGAVYFSNAKISKIDSDAYTTGISTLDNEDEETPDNILAVGNTDKTEDSEETTTSKNDVNFDWLIVPSLITSLAIIIAVIGVLIRNIKKNAPKKPVDNREYSNKNLKKLADNRKEEIKSINNQCLQLENEQNKKAIEINSLKSDKDKNKDKIAQLTEEYNEISNKIQELKSSKDEVNNNYKNKLKDLKDKKKADKEMKKKH